MSVPETSQRPWAAPEFKVGQRVRRRVFRLDAATEGTVVRFNWRGWPVVRWDGTQEPHTIHPVVLGSGRRRSSCWSGFEARLKRLPDQCVGSRPASTGQRRRHRRNPRK